MMLKNTRKIFCSSTLCYILTLLGLFILYYLNFIFKIQKLHLNISNYNSTFLIFALICFAASVALILLVKKIKNLEIWKLYIILATILGMLYLIVIPLFAQSDEPSHYYRSYEISNGYLLTPKMHDKFANSFPKSIVEIMYVDYHQKSREYKKYDDELKMMKYSLNKRQDVIVSKYVTSYPFVNYLPQAIGMRIATFLNLGPFYVGILGRLAILITGIILFGLAIKTLPYKKLFATVVFLSPVVLSYMASLSADTITLAASFLLISYVLKYMKTKEVLNTKNIILLITLIICVSLCKVVYLPLIGLIFLIPKECFKTSKKRILLCLITLIIGIAANFIWTDLARIITNKPGYAITYRWILSNPLSYFFIILRTVIINFYDYITNMFAGHYLCQNQVNPYPIIPIIYIIVTLLAYLSEKTVLQISKLQKRIILAIGILIFILISTAMYVCYTTPATYNGFSFIRGVQGRYLLPVLPLLLFFGKTKKVDIENNKLIYIVIILNMAVYLTMIVTFIA